MTGHMDHQGLDNDLRALPCPPLLCQVNPQFYAFRWITLLLTQEFGFPQILRLWDCILCSPDGPMVS